MESSVCMLIAPTCTFAFWILLPYFLLTCTFMKMFTNISSVFGFTYFVELPSVPKLHQISFDITQMRQWMVEAWERTSHYFINLIVQVFISLNQTFQLIKVFSIICSVRAILPIKHCCSSVVNIYAIILPIAFHFFFFIVLLVKVEIIYIFSWESEA